MRALAFQLSEIKLPENAMSSNWKLRVFCVRVFPNYLFIWWWKLAKINKITVVCARKLSQLIFILNVNIRFRHTLYKCIKRKSIFRGENSVSFRALVFPIRHRQWPFNFSVRSTTSLIRSILSSLLFSGIFSSEKIKVLTIKNHCSPADNKSVGRFMKNTRPISDFHSSDHTKDITHQILIILWTNCNYHIIISAS